jgi:hypothetical protein
MTSVDRAPRQVPANALYTNIRDVRSSIFTAAGVAVTWTGDSAGIAGQLSTLGGALFRDMGKTVYLPDPTVPSANGSQSTIMRKVQFVTGYFGTGNSATSDYYTGYIKLGGQTYGGGGDPAGGAAAPYGFVRAN